MSADARILLLGSCLPTAKAAGAKASLALGTVVPWRCSLLLEARRQVRPPMMGKVRLDAPEPDAGFLHEQSETLGRKIDGISDLCLSDGFAYPFAQHL